MRLNSLAKTDEICRAAESMTLQMRVVEGNTSSSLARRQPGQENQENQLTESITTVAIDMNTRKRPVLHWEKRATNATRRTTLQ